MPDQLLPSTHQISTQTQTAVNHKQLTHNLVQMATIYFFFMQLNDQQQAQLLQRNCYLRYHTVKCTLDGIALQRRQTCANQ